MCGVSFKGADLRESVVSYTGHFRCQPKLEPVGLDWATFQVLRRTNASLGHDAGVDPKVATGQRGHGIGEAIDMYTKARLNKKAAAASLLEKTVLSA